MKRRSLTFLLAGMAALAIAISSFLIAPSVDAGGECGSCNGPVHTVTGHGSSSSSCSQAIDRARTDAINQSWSGGASCTPCQTSVGAKSCAVNSCQGTCTPTYLSSYTLNYKCQACNPGGPEIPGL